MTTVELIDSMIQQDGGALFRRHLKQRMLALTDAFDDTEDISGRGHVGASTIGDTCPRKIWFDFRCAQRGVFPGRILRLFNRGHLEEARFEAMLLMIGCELWTHDANGKQFRLQDFGGHFGGSLDSVVRGIPEMPTEAVLAEYKTHSDKSFTGLVDKGLYKAHAKHYIQMQLYMHYFSLQHGLYLAVNKNNDKLYQEIVPYRRELALQYRDRAKEIIFARRIPKRISNSPGWWQCKMCGLHGFCHNGQTFQLVNQTCRNCSYGITAEEGWQCIKGPVPVAVASTQTCPSWTLHPDLG